MKNNMFETLAVLCKSCNCSEYDYDDSGHNLKCYDCFFSNHSEVINKNEFELPKDIEILLNMK
jgi:hypothetical protein